MKNNTNTSLQSLLPSYRDEFIQSFSSIFDSLFDKNMKGLFDISAETGGRPKVNILDYNDRINIIAEIAGFSKEEVNIIVKEDVLTICGSKSKEKSSSSDTSVTYIRRELSNTRFERSFVLGNNLNLENISAEFNNGILSIVIPKVLKSETQSSRKIEIK